MKRKIKYKKERALKSWQIYKNAALKLIKDITLNNPELNNFKYKNINVKNQKTRWGSCSSKSNLNFNYRIAHLPYNLAEYIVVHEFCHLKEMNHSKKYWSLVSKLIPNYKLIKKQLRKYTIN